tara:strand:+ start:91 stop:288 length:198 start_codon:yes stop_codon:yes gene_type:complete
VIGVGGKIPIVVIGTIQFIYIDRARLMIGMTLWRMFGVLLKLFSKKYLLASSPRRFHQLEILISA